MRSKNPLTLSRFFIKALYFTAAFSLFFIGKNGEPFALALLFSTAFIPLHSTLCALLYSVSAFAHFSFTFFWLYLGQAALLHICIFFYKKYRCQHPSIPFAGLFSALALFVLFSPFDEYALPSSLSFLNNPLAQKILIAGAIFLFSAASTVAVKALFFKLLKCRLKTEELLFCALVFVAVGVGVCRAASSTVYIGIALFLLLYYSCAAKDATAVVCAFLLSLPPFLCVGLSPERFFVYGIAVFLFASAGRFWSAAALLSVFFYYGYLDGIFSTSSAHLTFYVLSGVLPCLLFILIPAPAVRKLENKLVFYRERHLSRIAINRNRASIGEQLFEISGVFREIQATFSALGSTEAEDGAKEYVKAFAVETVCKTCENASSCIKKGRDEQLKKLVEVGAAKGKANLLDIPSALAERCQMQSDLLYAVNKQLGDYKKYMLEAENAKDGRNLLANQAQGVSEILKNIALVQSQPLRIRSDLEKRLELALLKAGVVCSEILASGEEDCPALSMITFGNADVKKIAAVSSEVLKKKMIISEKLSLGKDKYCCILRKKPAFDAAFGVASAKKAGESASGDTHSVIRIDERRFMLALSDGMGSGEYARRISESTVALLESFYRAKMPSPLVLSTINKLLTFNKEESFACVDIALVDLDTGRADIVKIGSPMGFILSDHSLRILDGGSLPLGILDSLRPQTSSYDLRSDDVLLFLSDGITSAYPSSADLYDELKKIPALNPQQLADALLYRAIELCGGVAKDDMTVLAVRIFKAD